MNRDDHLPVQPALFYPHHRHLGLLLSNYPYLNKIEV